MKRINAIKGSLTMIASALLCWTLREGLALETLYGYVWAAFVISVFLILIPSIWVWDNLSFKINKWLYVTLSLLCVCLPPFLLNWHIGSVMPIWLDWVLFIVLYGIMILLSFSYSDSPDKKKL